MPYIGNITSDFSIDTGNITNRAVTATKLSPSSVGSNGQVLSVDGSGNLQWSADASGTALTGSTNNTITTVTGANAIQGEANLTFNNSALSIINTSNLGDSFLYITAGEAGASVIELQADEADDNNDLWRIQNAGDSKLGFRSKTSGSWVEKLGITADGHVGIGVTPSAWPTNADSIALQIGTGFSAYGRGSGDEDRGGIAVNYYNDGSNEKYIANGHANRIYMNDGNIEFQTAAANASGAGAALNFTSGIRMKADGKILIGTTTSNTSDRFTIIDPGNAFMSLRSDAEADGNSQVIDFAVGTADRSSSNLVSTITSAIPTGAGAGGTLKGYLAFSTNSGDNLSERFRIDPTGFIHHKFTSNNSTVAEGLFINNQQNTTGNNASLILSNDSGNRKKAAVSLIDTGNYGAGDLVFALDGADSGELNVSNDEKVRIKNNGDVTFAGNIKTNNLSGRNFIINGAMKIAQRGTAANAAQDIQTVDRFGIAQNVVSGAMTQSQGNGTGAEFRSSYRIDITTAKASLAAGDYAPIYYTIEAKDAVAFGNGTTGAKKITLSFWVKSNKTGTYCFSLRSHDPNRLITATYAISSADTWEKKELNIAADTAGAQINDDNGHGFILYWMLCAGSTFTGVNTTTWQTYNNGGFAYQQGVNLFDSTSNYFELTGVQFEIGSTATPFEHVSEAEELNRCYRYCELIVGDSAGAYIANSVGYTTDQLYSIFRFKTEKRDTPTLQHTTGTNYYQNWHNNGGTYINSFSGTSWPNKWATGIYTSSAVAAKEAGLLGAANSDARVLFLSEL